MSIRMAHSQQMQRLSKKILIWAIYSKFAFCYQGGDSCCDNKVGGCGVNEGDCDSNAHCSGHCVTTKFYL